ncbi:MAG: prolipoprotein diacylglyceryl transferase [Pelagibacteraceae bacterium]
MYIHNLNPILVDLGIIEIRWYSLAYIIGILGGWWVGKKILIYKTKPTENLKIENFDNLISYLILGIILGGRIGYIIFYNLPFYYENPLEIFKIWQGGMSFHGAVVGVVFATLLFSNSKKRNFNSLLFLDVIACVAPIGLFFGRIANFINAELYGRPSEFFWSVIFPTVDNLPRHPSQLYEAFLEGIILFIILITISKKREIKTGVCSSFFLIIYGVFRIFCEQFREPDIQIGYIYKKLSMGSFLSLLMLLIGLILFAKIKKNEI